MLIKIFAALRKHAREINHAWENTASDQGAMRSRNKLCQSNVGVESVLERNPKKLRSDTNDLQTEASGGNGDWCDF
ncbi:MAG: hypothetical protein WC824_05460 [Bacteroidota bacterium]|jgi:hypothetical protein